MPHKHESMIWKIKPDLEILQDGISKEHISEHIGIEFTEIGDDYITAKMPVDHRTRQPLGLLHGGASCVLAESIGSVAGSLCIDMNKQIVVGLEINANHIRGVREGYVFGTARPIHIGRSTQVWDIKIVNESKQLVCISRLTLAVKDL